jgi:hypothetical protein
MPPGEIKTGPFEGQPYLFTWWKIKHKTEKNERKKDFKIAESVFENNGRFFRSTKRVLNSSVFMDNIGVMP